MQFSQKMNFTAFKSCDAKKFKNDQKLKPMASCLKKIFFDSMHDSLMDKNPSDENRSLTFKNILSLGIKF